MPTCAVCGIRDPYRQNYSNIPLDSLQILKYTEVEKLVRKHEENIHVYIPVSEIDWKYVQPCLLRSCYKSLDGAYYHLHPEFVNDREQATVCNDCLASLKKNEIPKLSIANGIDFGDYNRIGLTKPNTFKLSIIGIVTAYFKIIKLTSISILKIHRLMWKLAPGSLLGGKAPLSS